MVAIIPIFFVSLLLRCLFLFHRDIIAFRRLTSLAVIKIDKLNVNEKFANSFCHCECFESGFEQNEIINNRKLWNFRLKISSYQSNFIEASDPTCKHIYGSIWSQYNHIHNFILKTQHKVTKHWVEDRNKKVRLEVLYKGILNRGV